MHDQHTRILALEVRYRKLGFAAMESKLLLDAGIRTFRTARRTTMRKSASFNVSTVPRRHQTREPQESASS